MIGGTLNQKTVTVKIKRADLCDLLIACTVLNSDARDSTYKWAKLHDKLKEVLDDFDSKQEEK